MKHRALLLAALGLTLSFLAIPACSNGSDEAGDVPAIPGGATWVDDPFSGGYPTYDDENTGLRIVFGTPDLGAGTSRVSFALFDDIGLVSFPVIEVATRFYPEGADGDFEPGQEATFEFAEFPQGSRGIYVGELDFAEPGLWALDVTVPQDDGSSAQVVFPVEVAEEATAPGVGEQAPASDSRTIEDEPDLARLTTASEPDPRLYDTSIADALEQGRPFAVTFASPAYCTNALCGPQVEVLSALADEYGERATFIHVDLYENPLEIRGDFSLAERTPVLHEWGVRTDEWTFVVDETGTVTARFEGFAPQEEVETAVLAVLEG